MNKIIIATSVLVVILLFLILSNDVINKYNLIKVFFPSGIPENIVVHYKSSNSINWIRIEGDKDVLRNYLIDDWDMVSIDQFLISNQIVDVKDILKNEGFVMADVEQSHIKIFEHSNIGYSLFIVSGSNNHGIILFYIFQT